MYESPGVLTRCRYFHIYSCSPHCSPYSNDGSFLLAAYILTESVALVCLDIIGYVDNSYLREIAASIQFIEVSFVHLSLVSIFKALMAEYSSCCHSVSFLKHASLSCLMCVCCSPTG